MPKTIGDQWKSFERACIHPAAPVAQRDAMKMAFYGGATALLSGIMGMLEPGPDPTDADLAGIAAIDRELREFADSCGRAGAGGAVN